MLDRRIAATLPLVGMLAGGCPNDAGFLGGGSDPTSPAGEDPYYCCDPDEYPCLCEGFWHCTDGAFGKTCRQTSPNLPDDGGTGPWSCEYRDDLIVCSGREDEHPSAGQDSAWDCVRESGTVECSRAQDDSDQPSGEGDGPWECSFSEGGGLRACSDRSEQGSDVGGDGWECAVAWDGSTVCVDEEPETPDGGEWECVQVEGRDVCEGDHMPEGGDGAGWDCSVEGEVVRCEDGTAQQPDGGGDGGWDCYWSNDEFEITCIQNGDLTEGGGEERDRDQGREGGGDEPGGGDDTGEGGGEEDCACPPDAWRYCDTPAYCSWGIQECEETMGKSRWGRCEEDLIHIPGACWNGEMFDPEAEQCAIDEGFCVQDFWDLDRDGDSDETLGGDCPEVGQCIGGGGGDDWDDWF